MDEIEEELDELEVKLNLLKMEYDQYFLGILKREPYVLKGDIQKTMHRYLSQPPTRARTKFRFNTLCARYQSYRQLWSRTLRQMEEDGLLEVRGSRILVKDCLRMRQDLHS